MISLVFGVLIDLNMALTAPLECITLSDQIVTQVAGCTIVGIGTLFAMIYVGLVVKFIGRRMAWFDRLLLYRPGVRRYIYGLLRFLHPDRE